MMNDPTPDTFRYHTQTRFNYDKYCQNATTCIIGHTLLSGRYLIMRYLEMQFLMSNVM